MPSAVIGKVLQRLNSYVVLVIATLQAEFPQWEVLQSFAAFDLQGLLYDYHADLRRIAQTFSIGETRLLADYAQALPTARKLKSTRPSTSNFDCWRLAWIHHGRSPALSAALARYSSCSGCTTSGVEQLHSLQDWLWPKRRGQIQPGRAEAEMKIVVDAAEYDKQATLQAAQGVWKTYFGQPRLHVRSRQDKGSTKPRKLGNTFANWKRSYQAAVHRGAARQHSQSLAHYQQSAARNVGDTWGETKDKELHRQQAMKREHLLQSLTEGTLLSECTAGTDAAQERIKKLAELRSKRKREAGCPIHRKT